MKVSETRNEKETLVTNLETLPGRSNVIHDNQYLFFKKTCLEMFSIRYPSMTSLRALSRERRKKKCKKKLNCEFETHGLTNKIMLKKMLKYVIKVRIPKKHTLVRIMLSTLSKKNKMHVPVRV